VEKQIVVMDASIARLNARTPLDAGIYFAGFEDDKEVWGSHRRETAKKYNTVQEAVDDARRLKVLYPDHIQPKVYEITINGNTFSLNDVRY